MKVSANQRLVHDTDLLTMDGQAMTDQEVEQTLLQLRRAHEEIASWKTIGQRLERALDDAGIGYQLSMVHTEWWRTDSATESPEPRG